MNKTLGYQARKQRPARRTKIGDWFQHGDRVWTAAIFLASIVIILLVIWIAIRLWNESAPSRHEFGWAFVSPWAPPAWNPALDKFQAWPAIYGSLITAVLALIMAIPFSLGIAIFLAELVPAQLRTTLNYMVEMLAAIPSVVYGLWGIYVFLPLVIVPIGNAIDATVGHIPGLSVFLGGPMPASGFSRLGAAFILTIMITPTIAAVSRDVLLAIPNTQREASLALGATQWETIWKVLLPYGSSGILGAVILGFGRAIGETMAVTMVIGNTTGGGFSILKPGYTMASIIANEFAEAVDTLHTSALVEIGVALFILTLILNGLARWLVWRVDRRIMGK